MGLLIFIQVVIFSVFSSSSSDAAHYKSVVAQTVYCCIVLDTGDEILRQGTLISAEYVTMSTYYLYGFTPDKVTCILGAYNISEYEPTQVWFDIPTGNIIVHEKYNQEKKYENNIALIKLPEHVESSDYIQPAVLPHNGQNLANIQMTGVSRDEKTSAPNIRSVMIANNDECSNIQDGYGEHNFCTLTESNTGSEYTFIEQPNGSWMLIGFSLSSSAVNDTWRKQVSCRLDYYLDWIYEHTNIPKIRGDKLVVSFQ